MSYTSSKRRRRTARYYAGAAAVLTVGALTVAATPATAATTTALAITVNVDDTSGAVIPEDFLGLSLEWSTKQEYFGLSSTSLNVPTMQLLSNLGKGSLRIGGWSSDGYHYDAGASSNFSQPFTGNYGPDAIKTILKVGSTSNWKVTLGCSSAAKVAPFNSPGGDDALASECARGMSYGVNDSGYGAALDGFEVGNERNAAGANTGARPPSLAWDNYRALFYKFGHVTAQYGLGGLPMMGPAAAGCGGGYCSTMPKLANDSVYGVGPNRIGFFSYHYYTESLRTIDPGESTSGYIPTSTPNVYIRDYNSDGVFNLHDVLSQAAMNSAQGQMTTAKTGAGTFPVRMDEGNSLSLGPAKTYGIVNTQGAALWGADYLFTAAKAGLAGVNFHGCRDNDGSQCEYNPFLAATPAPGTSQYTATAQPLYYGMYLFKFAAGNRLISTTPSSTSDNIKIYATRDNVAAPAAGPNRYRVWVINKGANTQAVTLHPTRPTGAGVYFGVTSPNNDPNAPQATKVGGGTFTPTGQLQGFTQTTVNPNAAGNYTFSVPPYSAYIFSASY